MVATVKIGHGNGHNNVSIYEYINRSRCDSFGADEVQKLLVPLGNLAWSRVTVAGKGWVEERNRAKATAVITKNKNPNIGELTRQMSERVAAHERNAPDRVLVCSMYEHPVAKQAKAEGLAHFEFFPDAGPWPKNSDSKSRVTREYKESVETLQETVVWARRDGLIPIITGDFQMTPGTDVPWNPYEVVGKNLRMGLSPVVVNGKAKIDGIMWDHRLTRVGPMQIKQLFDHWGFTMHFKAALS